MCSDANGSSYTLGESHVTHEKHTPRHIFNTQERQNRKAFQQLNGHVNSTTPRQVIPSDQAYRKCYIAPPREPPSRMKAPPQIMPKTHYTN